MCRDKIIINYAEERLCSAKIHLFRYKIFVIQDPRIPDANVFLMFSLVKRVSDNLIQPIFNTLHTTFLT